jgi:hypothetical protein
MHSIVPQHVSLYYTLVIRLIERLSIRTISETQGSNQDIVVGAEQIRGNFERSQLRRVLRLGQ